MKVLDLFPPCSLPKCEDDTPNHRHILPQQQELLDSTEKFVAMVGGYGCIAGDTVIAGVPVAERQVALPVASLNGNSLAEPAFLKGRDALYRVSIRSGRQVVVTSSHQFLTPIGWRRLASLASGVLIAIGEVEHDAPDSARQASSQGCYSRDPHLGDGLLPPSVAAYPNRLQQLRKIVAYESALLVSRLLSIDDFLAHVYSYCLVLFPRTPRLFSLFLRLLHEAAQFLYRFDHLKIAGQLLRTLDRLEYPYDIAHVSLSRDLDNESTQSYPPIYQGWDSIVKIEYVKEGDFYDLHIPGAQHYLAHGIWHHNSGKTLAASVLGHLLSISISGNMGIVLRRSLPKLHDSTERIYLEVLNRSGVPYAQRELRDGWPGRIIYGNGSEVVFRETKDPARFLGPEYGWFFIDEAQEEPVKLFNDLTGRLRLIRAADYLRGILGTNPPSQQHWIAKKFPKHGSWTEKMTVRGEIVEISYRMIRSSTYDNPFLNPEYVAGLMQTHTVSEVKRIVEGHYGFVMEGDPVYSRFDFLKHVSDPPARLMSLYRVWDFGYHCPAVTWGQIFRCKQGGLHMVVLHEMIRQSIEAAALAPLVLQDTATMFPTIPAQLVLDGGDAAGAAMSDKGPGPIITLGRPPSEGGYNLRFRYRKFADIDPGLDLVRSLIRTRCKCNYYLLTVHRRCQELIQALSGGYHFPKEKPGLEKKRKPVKDGFYDNLADTIRYMVELFYRPALLGNMIEAEGAVLPAIGSDNAWAWMGDEALTLPRTDDRMVPNAN